LGNYFGMMNQALSLQEQGKTFLFIANYHALTTIHDPAELRENTLDVALDFLACGLDTEKTIFFRQSDVPEITELTWLLSTVTPMGLLERCHSYKDKTSKGIAPSHALFSYPVLMAADILAYQSTTVPVGRDQKQHVEVTRDIALKFNNRYGEVFTIPEESIIQSVAEVPGIDGRKMSKSYDNHIEIFGSKKDVKTRIMRIVTDSTPLEEPKDPDSCNVFAIYKLVASPADVELMAERYRAGNFGYGHAKKALLEAVEAYFAPFCKRREELQKDMAFVESVLSKGGETARATASKTLDVARKACGLD
jgi:tryptophanyl-tRNA synthetase